MEPLPLPQHQYQSNNNIPNKDVIIEHNLKIMPSYSKEKQDKNVPMQEIIFKVKKNSNKDVNSDYKDNTKESEIQIASNSGNVFNCKKIQNTKEKHNSKVPVINNLKNFFIGKKNEDKDNKIQEDDKEVKISKLNAANIVNLADKRKKDKISEIIKEINEENIPIRENKLVIKSFMSNVPTDTSLITKPVIIKY